MTFSGVPISEALDSALVALRASGSATPRLDAEVLLAHALGVDRTRLVLDHDKPVEGPAIRAFRELVRRRSVEHAPVAYLVGIQGFRRLVLDIDPRVLIPRPETELLVELVLASPQAQEGGVAADVGTGSGAIALALASEGSFERVIATDVSADALDVARTNGASLGDTLRAPVDFRLGASVAPLAGERLDILVSNPPYISFAELEALPAAVRDWEPTVALVCPEDGLTVMRTLAGDGGRLLRPGGLLALEVDSRRAQRVAQIVRDTGAFTAPVVHRDFTGRERFVLATRRAAHHA